MSALASRRYNTAPIHHIWRHRAESFEAIVTDVREHALAGHRVRVCRRYGGTALFEVVYNRPLFLVRGAGGSPIGSYENVAWALMAGDEHVSPDEREGE